VAADLDITQLVDGNKGVHAMIPKAIFVGNDSAGHGVITLERTACFGSCPIYKVTIASDGAVTFTGQRFVRTQGTAKGQISRLSFRGLVDEFKRINYFALDNKYVPGEPNCQSPPTDMPSANTSIQIDRRTKSVAHYHGCKQKDLTELEDMIDRIAGTLK